jgi:hypothetical protein
MRRARQLWQWLRSTATKLRQTIGLTSKFASWLKKAKSQQAHDLIMPLGILIGTVAFGLWSQSFTASLFAWHRALLCCGHLQRERADACRIAKIGGCTAG